MSEGSQSRQLGLVSDPERLTLLTHDIRSALSDVVGGLRLIDRDELPAPQRGQFDRVRVSANLLSRLLEDALTAWLGFAPGAPKDPPVTNLRQLLHDLDLRWNSYASEAGDTHRVTCHAARDLPGCVSLDRLALSRILTNLLANALRHSARGDVTLVARANGAGALVFEVTDEGAGWPSDMIASGSDATSREITGGMPGSGYGLRIARDLAQRMRGKLTLLNRAEQCGARAVLTIPPGAWDEVSLAPSGPALPCLAGKTVLLADDSETSLLLLTDYLMLMGAEVVTTSDGGQAARALARGDIDLALIDIDLPVASGLSVQTDYRADVARCARPDIPFVAVTAYSLPDTAEQLIAAGFKGVLVKPLANATTFGRQLADVLGLSLVLPLPPDPGDKDTQGDMITRLQRLLATVGEDSADELLTRLEADLSIAARNLLGGLDADDPDRIRRGAHIASSVCGSIGAYNPQMQAARLLSRLETTEAAGAGPLIRHLVNEIESLAAQIRALQGPPEARV